MHSIIQNYGITIFLKSHTISIDFLMYAFYFYHYILNFDNIFVLGLFASSVATGDRHTCVLLSDGSIMCWGLNKNGQLGTGDTVSSDRPEAINLGIGEALNNKKVIPRLCACI